jgi:TorA maturation chaperone TorD
MEQVIASAGRRADSYKLLSECYYLPDDGLVRKIAGFTQTDTSFAGLISHLPPATGLDSLRVDYAALFVGPYKLLAPPYGSVYLETHRVMGDSTSDVSNFYRNEGLDIVIKDAPDHIAVELEFMHYLAVKQIEATKDANLQRLQAYRHRQCAFLRIHLARWMPEFAENVRRHAQTAFYRTLAKLTEIFIQKDADACM